MIEWVMGVVDWIEEEARQDPEYRALTEHQAELAPAVEEFSGGFPRMTGS